MVAHTEMIQVGPNIGVLFIEHHKPMKDTIYQAYQVTLYHSLTPDIKHRLLKHHELLNFFHNMKHGAKMDAFYGWMINFEALAPEMKN